MHFTANNFSIILLLIATIDLSTATLYTYTSVTRDGKLQETISPYETLPNANPNVIPKSASEASTCYRTKRSLRRGISQTYQIPQVRVQPAAPHPAITTLIIRCEPVRPRLPVCYKTEGFVCCNKTLENLMHVTFDTLKKNGRLNGCNSQILANSLQVKAEAAFNVSFETISSYGNFASKIHFHASYLCKLKKDGRYMLIYGTPVRKPQPKS